MKALVKEAHRRIEAALPEDEPDCVPDWVCELLIKLGRESLRGVVRKTDPTKPSLADLILHANRYAVRELLPASDLEEFDRAWPVTPNVEVSGG